MFRNSRHVGASAKAVSTGLLFLGTFGIVAQAQVVNGDFSKPALSAQEGFRMANQDQVTGWKTTDSQGQIEIWKDGPPAGPKFPPPPGFRQYAEVNANSHGTLSQMVAGIPDKSQYGFTFYHRGRHSPTAEDTIEVTVTDGAKVWTKRFSTTNAAWKKYSAVVGTKTGGGPVKLEFKAIATASGDNSIGNFLTGINLDQKVVPPACVQNAAGSYTWSSSAQPNAGALLPMGTTVLNPDGSSRNLRGNPERPVLTGVWQITDDCQVTINWGKGQYIDTLKVVGANLEGKNQKSQLLKGIRK